MVTAKKHYSVTEYFRHWLHYARAWLRWKMRPLSPEEKAERAWLRKEQQRRKQLKRELVVEARQYTKIIRQRLTRMGMCYRFRKSESDWLTSGLQEICFSRVGVSEEAIWLKIDTRRVPRKVKIAELISDETLNELSLSCQRHIEAMTSKEKGAWFIIDRGLGARGIPRHVKYATMLANYSKTAGPLVVPAGQGENQRFRFIDLASSLTPHLLVGGATGQGKSVFLNNVICSLIQRNNPDRLKLLLVDLKIVELVMYRGVPHLLTDLVDNGGNEIAPIVTERADVIPLLEAIYNEVQRRLQLFEEKARDIEEWNNKHRSNKLPYWILVIDEIANIMLDRSERGYARRAEQLLSDIAARGRAPGIHIIIATQRPQRDVVTGLIKANMPARVAFSCASNADSMIIMDTGEAYGLKPEGRMVLSRGRDKEEIQGPYVPTSMVEEIVRRVKGGATGVIDEARMRHDVTDIDIIAYALQELGGSLSKRKLYDYFRGQGVTQKDIDNFGVRVEGRQFEVNGATYFVEPASGQKSRQLVVCGLRFENPVQGPYPDDGSHPGTPPEIQKPLESLETPPGVSNPSESLETPDGTPDGVPEESLESPVETPTGVPEPLLLEAPAEAQDGNGSKPRKGKRSQREDLWV
jgi:hypothetical protein